MTFALAATLVVMPTRVHAAARTSETTDTEQLDCDPITNDLGTAIAGYSAFPDSADAYFALWAPDVEPFGDTPPTIIGQKPDLVSRTDTTIEFSMPLYSVDPDTGEPGDQIGSANAVFTVSDVGETQQLKDSHKDGNHLQRIVGTTTAISGSASLDAGAIGSFDFPTCSGSIEHSITYFNSPTSFAGAFVAASLACDGLTDDAGNTLALFVDTFNQDASLFLTIVTADGAFLSGGARSVPAIKTGNLRIRPIQLTDESGQAAGTASLIAELTVIDTQSTLQRRSDGTLKIVLETFAVHGALTTSTGLRFDLAACSASRERDQRIFNTHLIPKLGGKVPTNDGPDGALAIAIGGRKTEATMGTAFAPEVEATCAPVAHTLWFTFTGTGGTVTVDAAGSDFDTVVAIYAKASDTFSEVACDDDYPPDSGFRSLQSRVSVDTEPGATYYVQAGGFDASFLPFETAPEIGHLHLKVSG
jgi:hypothetical protein